MSNYSFRAKAESLGTLPNDRMEWLGLIVILLTLVYVGLLLWGILSS